MNDISIRAYIRRLSWRDFVGCCGHGWADSLDGCPGDGRRMNAAQYIPVLVMSLVVVMQCIELHVSAHVSGQHSRSILYDVLRLGS